jgi:superoxide dismutase
VFVFTKLDRTVLGKGIDITKATAVQSKYIYHNNPIFDVDMLNAGGLIVQTNKLSRAREFKVEAGETVKEAFSKFNTKNKVSYSGAFSASAKVNYNTQTTSNSTSGFVKAIGEVRIMDEYIDNTDLKFLSSFLTKQFVSDIQTKSAADMLNMYGSHVIARCFWGGIAELDFMYTSTYISKKDRLKVVVEASFSGFGASSENVSESEKTDFSKNHIVTITNDGGDMNARSVEEFNKQYNSWVKSIDRRPVVCGIDEFNESSNMLPLWKIVEVVNPKKAKEIFDAFDDRLRLAENVLNGIKIHVPALKSIDVRHQTKALDAIPYGFDHVVLFDLYDRQNNRVNIESNNEKKKLFFDANLGRSGSGFIHIFYNTKQTTNYVKDNAIVDIIVLEGENTRPPTGYEKIHFDINAGCGKGSKYLCLAVKRATDKDQQRFV